MIRNVYSYDKVLVPVYRRLALTIWVIRGCNKFSDIQVSSHFFNDATRDVRQFGHVCVINATQQVSYRSDGVILRQRQGETCRFIPTYAQGPPEASHYLG